MKQLWGGRPTTEPAGRVPEVDIALQVEPELRRREDAYG